MFLDSKHAEAHFSPNATDSLYLLVAQMPRPRDMVIFVLTTTTTTTTTRPITLPLAHARGVITGTPTASMMKNDKVRHNMTSLLAVTILFLLPLDTSFHLLRPRRGGWADYTRDKLKLPMQELELKVQRAYAQGGGGGVIAGFYGIIM